MWVYSLNHTLLFGRFRRAGRAGRPAAGVILGLAAATLLGVDMLNNEKTKILLIIITLIYNATSRTHHTFSKEFQTWRFAPKEYSAGAMPDPISLFLNGSKSVQCPTVVIISSY